MEKYVNADTGIVLYAESFGKPTDRPALLIMGAMNQGVFWPDAFCEELAAAGFHVVRYDHRDTGKSSSVDFSANPYDLNTLMADALALIHEFKMQDPLIVGLSMGGYIAQLLAIKNPELVHQLVLISTTADQRPYMAATMGQSTAGFTLPGPSQKLLDYIQSMAEHPPTSSEAMFDRVLQGWEITYSGPRPFPKAQVAEALRRAAQRSSNPAASFQHALAVARSPDRLEQVKQIQAPTLIIHGSFDPCFPVAHADYLAQQIPKSTLQCFEMGHSFMWSWDKEILSATLHFAER